MMFIHIRRGFINLVSHNSSLFCKSRLPLSLYFSTATELLQPPTTPVLPEFLIKNYHFRPQTASHLASVLNSLKNPQKSDLMLSFLKESGFSVTQMERILKSRPELLSTNIDKIIKPKIKIFQEFGFRDNDIVEMISKDPAILHCNAKRLIPSLAVLKGLLGSTAEVAKLLKSSGWYLTSDLDNKLLPNINFLKSCGVATEKILWLMYNFPRFLLRKTEDMKKRVEKAVQLGADRSSKMFIESVLVISSMNYENLELKMKTFRDLGFSEDDILRLFRLEPHLFRVSREKINKLKEFLVTTGRYDVSCVVKNPTSLTRSIEKRYKPRFQVLEILERKKLIRNWPTFCAVYKMTDKKFIEKFVSPYYDEVGEVYMKKKGLSY